MTVDISLWPIFFALVFFKAFPWVKEIVDRLIPKSSPEDSLKALADRISAIEMANGMTKRKL